MKKVFIVFLPIFISLFLFSCGDDGQDGDAYIAITWVGGPFTYWTDDPAIPYTFYNNHYYLTWPGKYNFMYESWDTSIWSGSYTIYINVGESGKLIKDGEDGADIYFLLVCYSTGPDFYAWPYPYYVSSKDYKILDNVNIELSADDFRKIEENKYHLFGFTNSQIAISTEKHDLDINFFNQLNDKENGMIIQEGNEGKYSYIFKYVQIR